MEIYHVLNRGVEKRDIVKDDSDRLRFVHSLFVFNDSNNVNENHRHGGVKLKADKRDHLVHLHAWCLMSNHYHLLLSPVADDPMNISKFMKKLNMGYAKYFNEKYDRSGYFWQGKYKKILLERDQHYNYIPYYIHLNPLDLSYPKWRTGEITKSQSVLNELQNYRWSSHLDYLGMKNFPSLIYTKLLMDTLGKPETYITNVLEVLSSSDLLKHSEEIEK